MLSLNKTSLYLISSLLQGISQYGKQSKSPLKKSLAFFGHKPRSMSKCFLKKTTHRYGTDGTNPA